MERNNVNATEYYMWMALSPKTPCGLIECGVGGNDHDDVILSDLNRVATAIAKGICAPFDIPWTVTPIVEQPKPATPSVQVPVAPAPPIVPTSPAPSVTPPAGVNPTTQNPILQEVLDALTKILNFFHIK